jgi:hypothetical protein
VQDRQVFLVGAGRLPHQQIIVGHAEITRWEQGRTIAVVRERARLAHQPVDDVPIVNVVLVAPPQPWQPFDELLRVPHFDVLHIQANVHLFADQSARHRVDIPLHVNQAAAVHSGRRTFARFQASFGQGTQLRELLRQTFTPPRVELIQQPLQKKIVVGSAREIPAATQHQGLIDRLLEAMMTLLDVAILVAMTRLDLLRRHATVRHQSFVTLRELFLVRRVVDCQTHPVGAMPLGHGAQLPQRVLQPFAQALEALREADRRRLPVRVRQDEVVHQMVETLLLDRHAQFVHRREVRRAQPAWLMHLREEHLLGRPARGTPELDVPLQRPQLVVGKTPRITPLQLAENRFGLEPRIAFEQVVDLAPDRLERIGPGRPIVRLGVFTGQLAQIAVFACRLLIHVREPRCPNDRAVIQKDLKQLADLFVSDHRKPPCAKSLRSIYAVSCNGKSNCRRRAVSIVPGRIIVVATGNLIVVRREV